MDIGQALNCTGNDPPNELGINAYGHRQRHQRTAQDRAVLDVLSSL